MSATSSHFSWTGRLNVVDLQRMSAVSGVWPRRSYESGLARRRSPGMQVSLDMLPVKPWSISGESSVPGYGYGIGRDALVDIGQNSIVHTKKFKAQGTSGWE